MILKELFKEQLKLDDRIIKEHKLEGQDLFNNKIVSFIVELAECSNEIRFFKHWSNKGPSPKSVILEEAIDCLHFLLSIGNDLNNDYLINYNYEADNKNITFTDDFIDIINKVTSLQVCHRGKHKELEEYMYIELLSAFLSFCNKLGFTEKDLEMAYYKKNAINYKRQDMGY